MLSAIIYCQTHKRKPVRYGFSLPLRDVQADLPAAWCRRCGSEVFRQTDDLCIRCRKAKGEIL